MNYYDILNLDKKATIEEINSSFRTLAKRYHPDLNKSHDAKDIFIQIYEAYSILKDERKRNIYDEHIFNKDNYIKKETEQTNNYKQWKEKAKKEANYYSETNFREFAKDVLENIKEEIITGCKERLAFLGICILIFPILMLCNNC